MPDIVKQSAKPQKAAKNSGSAWDLIDTITMLVYGVSGSGKTSLWGSFPGPILAAICSGGTRPGELRSINTPEMRKKIDARIIHSTQQMKGLIEEAKEGIATFVIDHGSGLQDLTLKEILGLDELPAQKSWGMAKQQEYGQSALMCKEIFRAALSLPCNVVIVAQEREFNSESGSDLIAPTVGAALTPSVTSWLNPACDYVVQTFIRPKTGTKMVAGKEQKQRLGGVEYCLRVAPHEVYTTKFRMPKGRELPEVIVDPSYDKIIKLIRGEK